MDSSSSITPLSFKYDVFLSFRAENTGYSFPGHLHKALHDKQLEVFVDYKLRRGEEMSQALLKAIIESKISVIIFSKDYAASKLCLEELVHILECREKYKQFVIPIFYGIEPVDIWMHNGSLAAALKKHEERYDDSSVMRWREALTEAVSLSGYDLQDFKSDSELIQAIVENILYKLYVIATPSSPENTHTVDIREEDSGHEDEDAIQVPKITVERMFVASNLILEIPSAVFDQLSSPRYVLASMLMSLATVLICIIELVYKGGEARVCWRWRKKIPWFYYPSPSHDKPFGTVIDFIGLLCAFFQCFFSVSYYVFYLRNINDPIQISIWPLVFAFCLLCSTFSKKSPRTPKKYALL